MPYGCKNWEPNKCVRCGALLGLSDCFESIYFETDEELADFYKAKGGKGFIKIG